MLLHAKRKGKVTSIPITRGGTRINHLFFVDNSLLFSKANAFEWDRIQKLLEFYEKALGEKLNWKKTSIFFSGAPSKKQKKIFFL
jgi:hypothetical protein